MARRCSNCKYSSMGSPNPLSDICDGCQNDGDTGWCGSTDHSVDVDSNDDDNDDFIMPFFISL